ncbi:ubiquitin-like protein ATG12 isoform X2 [Pogona vitticeps]
MVDRSSILLHSFCLPFVNNVKRWRLEDFNFMIPFLVLSSVYMKMLRKVIQRFTLKRLQVDVLLKAVGDTPIMKTKKWTVERTRTIQGLIDFIKKFLKLLASEQLFIYVNQSFAPSPDQEVGTLYECFGSDGKLVLHYCKSQAWG